MITARLVLRCRSRIYRTTPLLGPMPPLPNIQTFEVLRSESVKESNPLYRGWWSVPFQHESPLCTTGGDHHSRT